MTAAGSMPVVLITGAAGGLGCAMVEAFDAAGWRVMAAGHATPPPIRSPSVRPMCFDVRDGTAVRAAVAEILAVNGRVDVLVNNAGVVRDGPLPRMSDEDWDAVIGTHLKGAFLCSQAVLPSMTHRRSGHILNISSMSGRVGARGQGNYSAAKAGLLGLTLALAREVGGSGVRVNAVLPGVLPTPLTHGLSDEVIAGFVAANALGRIQEVTEVARQIVHLAGQRDVSGQVFALDSRIARWG